MAKNYSYHHTTLISAMLIHLASAIFENIVVYFFLILRILPFICALLCNKGQYNMKHKAP